MTQKVKLSDGTKTILKNFGTVNKNLMFRKGNKLSTISETKSIIAEAVVSESFESDFAIFDLPRFLAALSLYEDPELNISDKFVSIQEGKRKLNYTFAEPSMILTVTDETISKIKKVVESGNISFKLPYAVFQDVNKALLTLKLPEFAITGNGEEVTLKAVDTANPTGDTYSVVLGETEETFSAVFNAQNLKLLPFDYDVTYSTKGLAQFVSKVEGGPDVTYHIVAEQKK